VLANFSGNLVIGHFVYGFHADDASARVYFLEALFQFVLCLSGTEYKDGFRPSNAGDYRIVVDIEMARAGTLSAIVRRNMLWLE
jgi:hypothetical protein